MEGVAGGSEDGSVLGPDYYAGAYKEEAMGAPGYEAREIGAAGFDAGHHRGLKLEMHGFVFQDAMADRAENG